MSADDGAAGVAPTPGVAATPLLVACLCAEWCGTCRDYRPVFDTLARRFAGAARFAWIDIEDDDEALGSIDIENFPTLLVARGDTVAFFGTVLPHAQTAARLIETALQGDVWPGGEPMPAGLAARVRALADARAPGERSAEDR